MCATQNAQMKLPSRKSTGGCPTFPYQKKQENSLQLITERTRFIMIGFQITEEFPKRGTPEEK